MSGISELRRKKVDIRPFKREFVAQDEATIASIRTGLQFSAWHVDRMPPDVLEDLDRAYPEHAPRRLHARARSGVLLSRLGMHKEALACYDDAIKEDPKAYYLKGDALLELERYEEAVKCYEEAIEADPDSAPDLYRRCSRLSKLERHEDALKCYEKMTEIDPSDSVGYCRRGDILSKLERYEEASRCYGEALEIDPTSAVLCNRKGNTLSSMGMHKEAIECYNLAIKISPNSAMAYYYKGNSLSELKMHGAAQECYTEALKLDTDDSAISYKCVALIRLSKYTEVMECLLKLLEKNSGNHESQSGDLPTEDEAYIELIDPKIPDLAVELGEEKLIINT